MFVCLTHCVQSGEHPIVHEVHIPSYADLAQQISLNKLL